jgi:hypothetical protein
MDLRSISRRVILCMASHDGTRDIPPLDKLILTQVVGSRGNTGLHDLAIRKIFGPR